MPFHHSLSTRSEKLREHLLRAARAPRDSLLENDPVKFAHRYRDPLDREVVALFGALLAFGKVKAFFPKVEGLLAILGPAPRSYVLRYRPEHDREFFRGFRSRVYTGDDLRLLLAHLRMILEEHSSLESAFLACAQEPCSLQARLSAFARLFRRLPPQAVTGRSAAPRGYEHLVCDPGAGSTAKRWNLFLRWVVRPADGIDLGLWRRVSPASLVMPLDTHVGRISSLLGLRRRRTLDWKAAEEVTARLRELAPGDPLWFDFPLSHLGISGHCRGRLLPTVCGACPVREVCRVGQRLKGRGRRGVEPTFPERRPGPPGVERTRAGRGRGPRRPRQKADGSSR